MKSFIQTVRSYYKKHPRRMPWREDTSAYSVVISEIMLQQTQVSRVIEKYNSFVKKFPDWQALATAPTRDVLKEWSGLGYNRRALYLKRIAKKVMSSPDFIYLKQSQPDKVRKPKTSIRRDRFMQMPAQLQTLPGIGPNTAGSILAFAFNMPVPFIETNIRSIFIHFFFHEIEKREGRATCKKIGDAEIMPFIEKSLNDRQNHRQPREWYYALMDYGAYLKHQLPNPSRHSIHHVRQKPFKGSNRELRSKMLHIIMKEAQSQGSIRRRLKEYRPEDVLHNISDLVHEGFIVRYNGSYRIAS